MVKTFRPLHLHALVTRRFGNYFKYAIGLALIVFASCKSPISTLSSDNSTKFPAPPGTIQADDNFYFDKTEITNLDYREYLYWLKKHFGSQSEAYLKALPDTTVWSALDSAFAPFDALYLRNPVFANHPVAGVSYQQACNYTSWRSDRVAEVWLVQSKIIKYVEDAPADSLFTISKYLGGQYYGHAPDPSIRFLPRYRLPALEDYQRILAFADDLNTRNSQHCKGKHCPIKGLIGCNCEESVIKQDSASAFITSIPTLTTRCPSCRKDLITHLQGNLREYTSTDGAVFGSSFTDPCSEEWNQIRITYDAANAWTGFRNVCVYESIDVWTTDQ